MMSHARSAWWLETKSYARIVPPPPRFTRQPQKEKMFLAFRICARLIFSKKERTFFFLGFCPPSIRAGGGTMRTKFWQNYFLGRKGFCKTSAHLFLNSDVANGKGGVWGGIFHLLLFLFWGNSGRDLYFEKQNAP